MKTLTAFIALPGILLLCVVGLLALACGGEGCRLERWCAKQLTDGQAEEDSQ